MVDRLNRVTDSPLGYNTNVDGKFNANIGNFHIDSAYGGVSLYRTVSTSGGVSDVFRMGHTTKRELYHCMHALLTGIEIAESVLGETLAAKRLPQIVVTEVAS